MSENCNQHVSLYGTYLHYPRVHDNIIRNIFPQFFYCKHSTVKISIPTVPEKNSPVPCDRSVPLALLTSNCRFILPFLLNRGDTHWASRSLITKPGTSISSNTHVILSVGSRQAPAIWTDVPPRKIPDRGTTVILTGV